LRQVLIRPSFQDWCGNRLFETGTSFNALYREAFSQWREAASADGFELNTWDLRPVETADVFWFQDLPESRSEFDAILRRCRPGCRLVLQILETPLLSLQAFHPANQTGFHSVLRYDDIGQMSDGHFHYRLPNTRVDVAEGVSFQDRRGLLMLNSNRVEGFWAMRRPGLAGLPAVGKLLNGWMMSPGMMHEYLFQERYSYRRRLARSAEDGRENFLDIYGPGWKGEQISWARGFPNRPYRCARGVTKEPKHSLCQRYRFVAAVENYQGARGYISEKIFDALFAGAVPVYLGDEQISERIPTQAFVDVRNFSNPRQLLDKLIAMEESEWRALREAGQQFLNSPQFSLFDNAQFVHAAMRALWHAMHHDNIGRPVVSQRTAH